ncbi:MAG TPA: carboxypeptidase regulatory-like domain-containing protein [Verrucomicrobiae bacterium]|jgi:plastocyanin|nr:carboxypeptidase regulatory-like domain-containing protein [Verrucomicrobiae bacterium]
MKLSFALLTAIGVAGLANWASAADITGTVTLSGTPPPEREITPLESDAVCGKLNSGKVSTTFFVVGPNKGLADVIVMLKGVPAQPAAASTASAEIDQKGCLYRPQILAIQTGQKLIVKNSDPTMHNVHVNPTAPANLDAYSTKISQPQTPGSADLTYSFTAPENFMKFQCDVHPWMFAWVTVVDNPYFAMTDKDGKFTIKNVPPGHYKIAALHRKAAPQGVEKDVDVKDSGASVDFTLEVK